MNYCEIWEWLILLSGINFCREGDSVGRVSSDRNMGIEMFLFWKVGLMVLALLGSSYSTLSPTGVNFEGRRFSLNFLISLYHCGKKYFSFDFLAWVMVIEL